MKIKEIRLSQGLTQAEVCYRSGLSQAGLCRLEKGEYNPNITTLQSIAGALKCTVGELLGETPYKPAKRRTGGAS